MKYSDKGHSEREQTSQQRTSFMYTTLYRKSPLKENNHSTKDKMAGPEGVLIKRFHCMHYIHIIHTYIHTYVHMYICTYIHTYIHTHLHTYVHICTSRQ